MTQRATALTIEIKWCVGCDVGKLKINRSTCRNKLDKFIVVYRLSPALSLMVNLMGVVFNVLPCVGQQVKLQWKKLSRIKLLLKLVLRPKEIIEISNYNIK